MLCTAIIHKYSPDAVISSTWEAECTFHYISWLEFCSGTSNFQTQEEQNGFAKRKCYRLRDRKTKPRLAIISEAVQKDLRNVFAAMLNKATFKCSFAQHFRSNIVDIRSLENPLRLLYILLCIITVAIERSIRIWLAKRSQGMGEDIVQKPMLRRSAIYTRCKNKTSRIRSHHEDTMVLMINVSHDFKIEVQ